MKRTIEFNINNNKILVQKADRYIRESEIELAIEDIVRNLNVIQIGRNIDLSRTSDLMFSVTYQGVADDSILFQVS